MQRTVQYGTTIIQYDLQFALRKTLGIDVHPDLSVSVIAPEGSALADIEARVKKRGAWILRQQREFALYLPHLPARRYVSGETHRYLGKQYRLKVIENLDERVKLTRGRLFVYTTNTKNKERIRSLVTEWYRGHAQRIFAERLDTCFPRVAKYGLDYPEMEIRQMEKRWGSCTAEGKVLLNLKLIQAPKELIDYVVMHELCHLKEHHHGPSFYALLDRAMPNWRQRRQRLNEMDVA
ncbi:MAG: M48 family metallopeptidase [Anaerolineales bacterium]|nr:M48 family metallopeptidase [Anaerolineales bacterium]